jgi:hypothetical protein
MQAKGDCQPGEDSLLEATRAHGATQPTSKLMDGIKEELFMIEVQRKRAESPQPNTIRPRELSTKR